MLTCNMCGETDVHVHVEGAGRWHCCEAARDSPTPYQVAVCQTCGHVFGTWANDMTRLYTEEEYVTCDSDLGQYDSYVQFVLAGLPHRRRQPRVLEIGFNRGALLKRFYDLGFDCHGIEPGPRNVEAARAKMPNATLDVGLFDTDWVEKFGAEHFDVVMLTSVLEHLPNARDVLSAARRCLRPQGRLFLVVPDLCFYTPAFQTPAGPREWYGCSQLLFFYRNVFLCYAQHINHFSTPSLIRYLDALGLRTTQTANIANVWASATPHEPVDSSFDYPDLVQFHTKMMDHYERMLDDMRQGMLDKLANRTLVCYGAGREFHHFRDVFAPLGVEVAAVADDSLLEADVAGVPCIRPQEIARHKPDICVATSFEFEDGIAAKARSILPDSVEVLTLTQLICEHELTMPRFLEWQHQPVLALAGA